jgi:hypothetical protein
LRLVAGGWFVLREKYCWLVADKPSEQITAALLTVLSISFYSHNQMQKKNLNIFTKFPTTFVYESWTNSDYSYVVNA